MFQGIEFVFGWLLLCLGDFCPYLWPCLKKIAVVNINIKSILIRACGPYRSLSNWFDQGMS